MLAVVFTSGRDGFPVLGEIADYADRRAVARRSQRHDDRNTVVRELVALRSRDFVLVPPEYAVHALESTAPWKRQPHAATRVVSVASTTVSSSALLTKPRIMKSPSRFRQPPDAICSDSCSPAGACANAEQPVEDVASEQQREVTHGGLQEGAASRGMNFILPENPRAIGALAYLLRSTARARQGAIVAITARPTIPAYVSLSAA